MGGHYRDCFVFKSKACFPSLQDDSAELATSSDEEDAEHPAADGLVANGQPELKDGADVKPTGHRKRHRAAEVNDDPDQATSVRVRHNDHQHAAAPAVAHSSRPATATEAVQQDSHASTNGPAPHRAAAKAAAMSPAAPATAARGPPLHARPSDSQTAAMSMPAASASSQQGDCIGPDGTFVGRAAAAGLPPNIMRQTRAALGLWEQLHETASTPSTVLAPVNRQAHAARTVSVGTDNSAA